MKKYVDQWAAGDSSATFMVGDASHFYDPLSVQGISKALSSASRGVEAISLNLCGEQAYEEFADAGNREYQQHIAGYLAHYRREAQWPQHLFWKRRSVATLE